jgi:hypothetical protein
MARPTTSAERIQQARKLIQKARKLPVPPGGKSDFSYIAQVKDYFRQARDLVKLIPNTPTATPELKEEVKSIYAECEQANQELLH